MLSDRHARGSAILYRVTDKICECPLQTRPLVDYYSNWAKADAASAPKYRAISGTGSVEDITTRAFGALAG